MANDENTVKIMLVLGNNKLDVLKMQRQLFEYKRHFGFKVKIVRVEKQKMTEVEALDIFK